VRRRQPAPQLTVGVQDERSVKCRGLADGPHEGCELAPAAELRTGRPGARPEVTNSRLTSALSAESGST
jgi:hypothetical protein